MPKKTKPHTIRFKCRIDILLIDWQIEVKKSYFIIEPLIIFVQ